MAPALVQAAANSISKRGDGDEGSTFLRATFNQATKPGNLVIVVAVTGGGVELTHYLSASGFTRVRSHPRHDTQLTVWYRANCPSMTSIWVSVSAYRSMQLRLFEYSGVAQANALDKFVYEDDESERVYTPSTGTLGSSGELVFAVLENQYSSTTQYGFTGGLAKLYETTSPSGDSDWERTRVSFHQGLPTGTTSQSFGARLSTERHWVAFLLTFKPGTAGPANFSSTINTNMLQSAGGASLTVFGKLRSGVSNPNNAKVLGEVGSAMARVGPFDYQYRLGGWTGLLIGTGTPYRVESHEGLEGWSMRTSDDDLPRGDGALRGVDLQSARQIMFRVNFSGTKEEIEEQADILYRTLIPQRDQDWELIWRHPGRPLRIMRVRPTELIRELNQLQLLLHNQSFALRAADPRHYSAVEHMVTIPTSPTAVNEIETVLNLGNSHAYPEITMFVPSNGDTVTRVELVNQSADVIFDYRGVISVQSTLIGDMAARATGAPRSIITVDGQSKYGGWQFPREAFLLQPGENHLYLRVTPAWVPVQCTLRYRDTWSG